MKTFKLFEGKNCHRSSFYDRYVHVPNIFGIVRFPRKQRPGYTERIPYKIINLLENCGKPQWIELTIDDLDLLAEIKNYKGEFIVDRYIMSSYNKYFLKRYYPATIHNIHYNTIIFKSDECDVIRENVVEAIVRDEKLNELLQ